MNFACLLVCLLIVGCVLLLDLVLGWFDLVRACCVWLLVIGLNWAVLALILLLCFVICLVTCYCLVVYF